MGQDMWIVILSLGMGTLTYGLIAGWYVMPALTKRSREDALIPLLIPHAFRYIGLAFLVPGVVSANVDPAFATPAAYGDLAASVLALVAMIALRFRWALAIPLVWIFNLEGSLDMVVALSQGLRLVDAGQLGGALFIPLTIVPLLLVTHVMIFRLLLRKGQPHEPRSRGFSRREG